MKFLVQFLLHVVFNFLIINSNGYKILGVFPSVTKSHEFFCESIMRLLANRGHKVDVIATGKSENSTENYTMIFNLDDLMPFKAVEFNLDFVLSTYKEEVVKYKSTFVGNNFCQLLANEKLQKILQNLKQKHHYDLLVTQNFLANCFMGIAHFLNIPMITLSAQIFYPWVDNAIGNPESAAIYPNIYSRQMELSSFWDRLQNKIKIYNIINTFHGCTEKVQNAIMRKYLSPDVPSVRELEKSSLLSLVNTHFSFNGVRPLTPGAIEVGGLHIFQDRAKFSPDLQKWMDESEHGVVYFTLGSTVAIELMQKEIILRFFSSFAKLSPVRFLVRIRNSNKLPIAAPENVKMLPWIPQIPVLAHKNTKAFISHCGIFSSQEALHFGVPVLGFPLVLDQFLNMHNLKRLNMAIELNILSFSETELFNALTIILNNSKYREAAKKASQIFKDRPMNAEDTAVFWIEYAIRNGAILKSPVVDLHWTQRELLDVYGFMTILIISILYFTAKLAKFVLTSKVKTEDSKQKVN